MDTRTPLPVAKRASFIGLTADVAGAAGELAEEHGSQLRAEVRTELARGIAGIELLGAGGGLIGISAVFLLIAGIQLLQEYYGLSATAAWGTVGAVVGLVGIVIARFAHRRLLGVSLVPEQTLKSIRESVSWVSQR